MMRWLVCLVLSVGLGSCASPLTGLRCADGYTQCGNQCVDLDSDLMHCGSCDMMCPASGWVCIGGRCGMNIPGGGIDFDASIPDASMPGDATVDGGGDGGDGGGTVNPRPVPDPKLPLCDGSLPADECRCDVGSLKCGNDCVNPESDVQHCGGCDTVCLDGQFCAKGMCVDECVAPLVRCGRECIDVQSNFRHCGECGEVCPTHICSAGSCAGKANGHVVLIGHTYQRSNDSMDRIPPAAVSLNSKFSPRILGYRQYTGDTEFENINGLLFDSLGILPEDIQEAVLPALSLQLAESDVLIIYPQPLASQADLETKVRAAFDGVLPSFLSAGGVVLLFEGGGSNRGTYQILTVDDLVNVTGVRRVSSGPVLATEEGVFGFTSGVTTPYRGERITFGFLGVGIDQRGVLTYHEDSELPVIIHNIFSGK